MVFRSLFLLLFIFPLASQPGYHPPWGKNSDLIKKKQTLSNPSNSTSLLGSLAESVISFHQKTLSPLTGPRSHFRPTSSMYMLLSIRRYGFTKGYILGCDRLLRENNAPWLYRTRLIDNTHYKWDPTYE